MSDDEKKDMTADMTEEQPESKDSKAVGKDGKPLEKPTIKAWYAPLMLVLAVAIVFGGIAIKNRYDRKKAKQLYGKIAYEKDVQKYALALATYPELVKCPEMEYDKYYDKDDMFMEEAFDADYNEFVDSRTDLANLIQKYGKDKALGAVQQFTGRSMQRFLVNRNGENKVYSPINVYLMLGPLAEMTGGNSRQQILSLADATDVKDLRERSKALWTRLYAENDISNDYQFLLGGAAWLNNDSKQNFNKDTLEILKTDHHASTFAGKMGSSSYNKALQSWLNSMTGNLLKDSVQGEGFKNGDEFAYVTTILFEAAWEKPFNEEENEPGVFHAEDGDMNVTYMKKEFLEENYGYYRGEKFLAAPLPLTRGEVWFILPNEGVAVDELLDDPQVLKILERNMEMPDMHYARVYFSVPKFDFKSEFDLIPILKDMGVTDIFAAGTADFSPLTKTSIYCTGAKHAVRFAADEEKVSAAGYSVMYLSRSGSPAPDEELVFTLDRPFLFAVSARDINVPLFVGVVERPTEAN